MDMGVKVTGDDTGGYRVDGLPFQNKGDENEGSFGNADEDE